MMTSSQSDETKCYTPKPSLCIPGTICVEGNIGSGKTTLLAGLQKAGHIVYEEPMESRWAEHLVTLYSDPKRWGFTFQVEVVDWYKHLIPNLQKKLCMPGGGENQFKIVERSPISTYEIFGKNLKKMGNMTDWEMKLLGKVVESWAWIPEHTLYIKTPYTEAYERLKSRGRQGEENVPIELLRQLELRHEAYTNSKYCGAVHELDGMKSKEDVVAEAKLIINQLQSKKNKRLIRSRVL